MNNDDMNKVAFFIFVKSGILLSIAHRRIIYPFVCDIYDLFLGIFTTKPIFLDFK
ncbi:uncharacterized protein METZ01_LOCUS119386 [marine metagenome]|uniref:Uncharacterized protein n=1 Tax=marine metagenome TaxID=408172 RepID=A0A381XPW8_9ZZZZ